MTAAIVPRAHYNGGQQVPRRQLFQAIRNPSTSPVRWRVPVPHALTGQVSIIRVRYGVIPAVRTGLTVTWPAAEEASSIWLLPR